MTFLVIAGCGDSGGSGGNGGGGGDYPWDGGGTSGHGGAGGVGGVGGTGGAGAGSGTACGGLGGDSCSAADFCDWFDNSCGNADQQGVCHARPGACSALYDPVCGCDGKVYGNECSAYAAGVDLNAAGGCPAPMGWFGCGWEFCQHGTSYCREFVPGATDSPTTYSCAPLPSGCGSTPTCACIPQGAAAPPGNCQCSDLGGGDLLVICSGV